MASVSVNDKEFNKALEAFVGSFEKNNIAVVKAVALNVHDDLANMTPRDTGYASANWNLSVGSIDGTVKKKKGSFKRGAHKKGRLGKLKRYRLRNTIYISNNVHYIEHLERGHSKQARRGMLRLTIARWQRYMRKEAKRVVK